MFSLGLLSHVPLLFSFSSQENPFGEIKKKTEMRITQMLTSKRNSLRKEMSENQDNDLLGMYNKIDESNYI